MDNSLSKRIRSVQDKFVVMKSNREKMKKRLDELNREKANLIQTIDTRVATIDFVETVASNTRLGVKTKVENLITSCLKEVYDDTYSIVFDYGVKNNKTSVEIYIVRNCADGVVVKRTIDGMGGGVADTVSVPLKLIVLMNDKDSDKVLFADEPGKHLDKERVVKFGAFLKDIADKLGVQIIMTTHHESMNDFADNIHKVSLPDSVTEIERIK